MANSTSGSIRRIAVIGNYLPRRCGIATFTTDLCESLVAADPALSCFAIPVNDTPEGYPYPPRVRFEIEQNELSSYQRAADFLNINNVDLVCLQHEYGIFGGPAGSHILALLRELRMAVVTTLHTVLREPDEHQRHVMLELAERSDRLVVMSNRAVEFLREIYGVPEEKIDVIPHGIPDVPFVDPNFYKDQFGLQGKIVALTFGLLSPNKGIEYVIQALPEVLERFPNVVYVVLGATHPHVRLREGESYRLSLERLARACGVAGHVIFHNRFVSLEELVEFIGAADIYITPYLNPAQIVSGTLAYTVGAGKAVISTPYWYAEELLADGRGVLVPFRDSHALAAAMIRLLEDEAGRHAMRKRAYLAGREMIWPRVAERYLECFQRAREQRSYRPRPAFQAITLSQRSGELPEIKTDHLRALTDDTGLLQHAVFTVPNYSNGYTTDDNARALEAAVLLEESGARPLPGERYLAFLWYAFNAERGRFHNELSYERRWLDEVGSEDCHGRALSALGLVLGRSRNAGLRGLAGRLFDMALPAVVNFRSPRACAFCLIGIHHYLRRFPGDRAAQNARETLAARLMELWKSYSAPDWPWFEPILAYSNASLPHGLLLAGEDMGRPDMVRTALEALSWLTEVQRAGGNHFVPIGSNGFYPRGGTRARFDQQPVEAQVTVSACLAAWRVTGDERWKEEAQRAFEWFLGRNDLGLPLYDPATGGCRDGLHPDRVNQNEGAESTLAFLLSLLEMREAFAVIDAGSHAHLRATQPAGISIS
jgi:glycosyltransferase involved in cell wall biosynthesis